MGQLYVVAVFDEAIGAFGSPISVKAKGESIRSFIDETKNPESMLAKHPSDFSLYHLAMYDDEKGSFDPIVPPERLIAGRDLASLDQVKG